MVWAHLENELEEWMITARLEVVDDRSKLTVDPSTSYQG